MMENSKAQWREITALLDKLDDMDKAFATTIVYDYMITQIYAEFEQSLSDLLLSKTKSNNEFANAYIANQKQMHRGLKINDINGLLRGMKVLKKGGSCVNNKLQTQHDSFLTTRHSLTHTNMNKDRSNSLSIDIILANSDEILKQITQLLCL